MVAKFRRADGLEIEANEGSASFELMANDGAFQRIDLPDEAEKFEANSEDSGKVEKLKRSSK